MVELVTKTACAGLLPRTHGDLHVTEVDLGPLTSLSPYQDRQKDLSDALKEAHGVIYPAANRTDDSEGVHIIWHGRDVALLVGAQPDARLGEYAALSDQTDAWATVSLSGPGVEDVLARLAPVDVRTSVFPLGHTVRTLLGHMNVSITRTGEDSMLILAFRSMAGTLVHELSEAMETVAAHKG